MSSSSSNRSNLRASSDQISQALAAIDRSIGEGATVIEACARAQVAVPTYYRWLRRHRGRDGLIARDSRLLIIAAAKERFFSEGFDATLDDIAADAGVARQTVYNQFGSKQTLFTAVVLEVHSRLLRDMPAIAAQESDLETVISYGRQMAAVGLDQEAIALFRVAIAEFRRLPELGRTSFDLRESQALPKVTQQFAAFLAARPGASCAELDSDLAAEILYGAVVGFDRNRLLAGLPGSPPDDVERRIQKAARLLLAML